MASKTKKRSEFFRVAVEGATTDGRVIERQQIADIAETYDPQVYGARIWLEHFRSTLPDSPFRAYGDVLAVKAEEVDIAGKKKLALFAQVEPTDDLVDMVNVRKQKVFTSIEISPEFADSGKAYLFGLAVTDSPASLGTSMLAFSAQNPDSSPLKDRKQAPENLFTEAAETIIKFTAEDEPEARPGPVAALLSSLGLAKKPAPAPAKEDPDFNVAEFATQLLGNYRLAWVRGYKYEDYLPNVHRFNQIERRDGILPMLRHARADFYIDALTEAREVLGQADDPSTFKLTHIAARTLR